MSGFLEQDPPPPGGDGLKHSGAEDGDLGPQVGIEDFSWHGLRHSCASYLAMNGVPMRTIAEILGHKTLDMVHRYSHLSPEHLKEAVSGINEKIFG